MGSRARFRRYRTRKYTLHTVTDLRAEDNYTLWVRFDDGLEGHVYLGELVEFGQRPFRSQPRIKLVEVVDGKPVTPVAAPADSPAPTRTE